MNRPNSLLVAGLVAVGMVAAYLGQQLNKQQELLAATQAATAVQSPGHERPLVTSGPTVPAVATAPEQPESMTISPAIPTDPVARDIELRRRNPNYIGVVAGKSAEMQLRYPDLARELGMSPAEAESLYDLLMKHQREMSGVPRYTGEDEALGRETQRVLEELQQKQKVELDAKLAGREFAWREYQPTLDARRRVSELTNMVNTTSPLSDYQARMLVANVVAEQQRRANEQSLRAPPTNPLAQLEFDEANQKSREESNRRTVDASRAFLTEQQVTIMQNAMEGLNRNNRTLLQARRAQLEAGGVASPARGP